MANINDVINGLKTKYNITNSTTEQELLELLNVVTVDEINAIKATSVIPLPNVVKGSPQELKERFVKIVSDEQRGIANVINTRMGLLRIFLAAYMTLEAQRLGDKVNFTDIIDSLVSEATDKALSAKQGKVLKDLIDTLTVGTDRLVDGSVSESKLASNSVSEAKIKAGAITTDKLADDSVSNDKVKVNAIHTRNIKNGDITFDKLAQEVINYIDGIASGNSIYRGNYESVEDLPTGALIHNNDYAYVTIEVEDEETHEINPELARYKYSEGEWAFEYIIPNTSFSADEWEAIKSGITSTLVNKLKGIETGAQVNVQSDWNESDNTKDEYIKNKPNVVTTDTAQEISQDKTFNGAKIKFKNSAIDIWDIRKNGSTLEINRDNTVMMQLLTNIIKLRTLVPISDDETLGNTNNKWKDIWFSGSLKDGTNELSLAQLKSAYDKALSALQSHQDISGKLDKTSTANSLYANGVNGQIMVGFGMGANGGKIPQRDSDGQINVPTTPTNNEHAVSKKYVDDNIATETTRATSQENKALYHLGAYDIVNGNVITRRTGHATEKDFTEPKTSNTGRTFYTLDGKICDSTLNIINNLGYVNVGTNDWWNNSGLDNTRGFITYDAATGTLVVLPPVNTMPSGLNIQFTLPSSVQYTEKIIKDQPLCSLDATGSQFISNEWRKQLNNCAGGITSISKGYAGNGDLNAAGYGVSILSDNSFSFYRGSPSNASYMNIGLGFANFRKMLKPNTKYRLRVVGAMFQDVHINVNDSTTVQTNNLYSQNTVYINKTFMTPSTVDSFGVELITAFKSETITTTTCRIMISEGDGIYTDEDYNASKYITNDEAKLLQEESKRVNNVLAGVTRTYGVEVNFDTGVTYGSSSNHSVMDFDVKGSTTYYLKKASGGTYRVAFYKDTTYLGWTNITESIAFTTPANCNWARISLYYVDITPTLSAGGAIVHEIDLANGWGAIVSQNTMAIRYSKIGDLRMLFCSFDGYHISQIGETIYTVDFTTHPELAHSRTLRCVTGGDFISGTNTLGRISVNIDFRASGEIVAIPQIDNQATGSCDILLYGDSMIWFI